MHVALINYIRSVKMHFSNVDASYFYRVIISSKTDYKLLILSLNLSQKIIPLE